MDQCKQMGEGMCRIHARPGSVRIEGNGSWLKVTDHFTPESKSDPQIGPVDLSSLSVREKLDLGVNYAPWVGGAQRQTTYTSRGCTPKDGLNPRRTRRSDAGLHRGLFGGQRPKTYHC